MATQTTDTTQSARPLWVLAVALWFGLLAGLGETAILTAAEFWRGKYLRPDWSLVWVTDLADVAIFAAVGGLIALAAWSAPRLFTRQRVLTALAFVCAFDVLLRVSTFHWSARWLLAAGVAAQFGRWWRARPERLHTFMRRTAPLMLAVVVGLVVGLNGWRVIADRRLVDTVPAAPPRAPNVLLIVLDTVRAQELSLYGYAKPTTPWLEQFATRGTRFDQAFAAAPWTLASHAAFFTGRWPHELGVNWFRALDARAPTLAEMLRQRGYLTAGFVGNIVYCSRESGLSRGFAHYEDFVVTPGYALTLSALGFHIANKDSVRLLLQRYDMPGRKPAERINGDFLAWLADHPHRPFFAFLNYFDAHVPYLPPAPFDHMFGPPRPPGRMPIDGDRDLFKAKWPRSAAALAVERGAYDGAIAYTDQQLHHLFDALAARGLLDNTVVVITADHGEEMREHGFYGHGHSLYTEVLHVPLVIMGPGVPAGHVESDPVTLADLPATLLALTGSPAALPGRSLTDLWTTPNAAPATIPLLAELDTAANRLEFTPISKGSMRTLIAGPYHLIRNGDRSVELYNRQVDPGEQHDLSTLPAEQERRQQLESQLTRMTVETRVGR